MSRELGFDALLASVPTPNSAVRVERRGGSTVLFVPLRERAWTRLVRYLLPLRRERGYALDRLGEEVFRACDGKRALEHIIEEFARAHGLSFHEARVSVTQFMSMLCERRLLVLVVSGPLGAGRQ